MEDTNPTKLIHSTRVILPSRAVDNQHRQPKKKKKKNPAPRSKDSLDLSVEIDEAESNPNTHAPDTEDASAQSRIDIKI